MKRILITGSSGMLGVDLCKELCVDYELIGVDIAKAISTYSYRKCDITNKQEIFQVVKKARPNVVVHAAAMTDVDGCELNPEKARRINSEGAKNAALACKAADAALIYISTDFVFDGKKKSPYKETDKTNPISVYGDSKLKGEEAIKKAVKKHFILRTSWLYGKHGKNFVDTILAKAKGEKVLKVVDDQVGSPTYTKDLAKAIRALLDRVTKSPSHQVTCSRPRFSAPYGIYHVSNSGKVSWFDYAKEILRLAKMPAKIVPISSEELDRPASRPAMSVLDNSKFIKFTGYRMRSWQEALKEYVR